MAGRLRHNMRFVILVPKSLDPVARGRKMPVPDARPSAKIAKLFPQTDPAKDATSEATPQATSVASADAKPASPAPQAKGSPDVPPPATVAQASDISAMPAIAIPLPEPRPHIDGEHWHHRSIRRYYRDR